MAGGGAAVGLGLAGYIHYYTENTKLAIGVFWFFLMEFLQVSCKISLARKQPLPRARRERPRNAVDQKLAQNDVSLTTYQTGLAVLLVKTGTSHRGAISFLWLLWWYFVVSFVH